MPQIFQVLKCYKCFAFQVHQTKKSVHWKCKLCGVKQTMKRHYGVGTAKDCRMHVQKLNIARGEIDENKKLDSAGSDTDDEDLNVNQTHNTIKVKSKWSQFVEEISENEDVTLETMHMGDNQVVLEMPKKRSKKFHVGNSKKQQKVDINTQNKQTDPDIEFLEIMHSNNKQLKSYNCHQSTSMKKCDNNLKKNNSDNVSKINGNTKWAEFVEDITDDNDINSTLHDSNFSESSQLIESNDVTETVIYENNTVGKKLKGVQFIEENLAFDTKKDSAGYKTTFSLCNDNDLDDVLNI